MALVERLIGHVSEPTERHIPVHDFFAAVQEIISGRLTATQVQDFWQMTAADLTDWDALAATMPPQAQSANRAIWISGLHAVFLLASSGYPTYDTPAAVRTKLGI
jgi:hypothetical protein